MATTSTTTWHKQGEETNFVSVAQMTSEMFAFDYLSVPKLYKLYHKINTRNCFAVRWVLTGRGFFGRTLLLLQNK
jgi:hypothetical protein